ncbi:Glyoxalase/Bleomycin resistance protein/Dihydroxybiphenyl dioxygenase [Obelidium mucronatum]|nr:Glyoxalase/Bleomycin resistance protein/Dihydroxybiphenyl dioxygenase [Obelidium mucronatum]
MATVQKSTQKVTLNHICIRVKDPKKSLHFYRDILGMHVLNSFDSEGGKFSNYFLGFNVPEEIQNGTEEQKATYRSHTTGLIELTHNWGTETDDAFEYTGHKNQPGNGYAHICIVVDDIIEYSSYLEGAGVPFRKKLSEGVMRNIAFVLDPDGYSVELIERRK